MHSNASSSSSASCATPAWITSPTSSRASVRKSWSSTRRSRYLGAEADKAVTPKSARDALKLALATERRAQNFYIDVAEHANDDAVCAFAAEMAQDEQRHVVRLEQLLAREPESVKVSDEDAEILRR